MLFGFWKYTFLLSFLRRETKGALHQLENKFCILDRILRIFKIIFLGWDEVLGAIKTEFPFLAQALGNPLYFPQVFFKQRREKLTVLFQGTAHIVYFRHLYANCPKNCFQ